MDRPGQGPILEIREEVRDVARHRRNGRADSWPMPRVAGRHHGVNFPEADIAEQPLLVTAVFVLSALAPVAEIRCSRW
jgi:hypothetical protein